MTRNTKHCLLRKIIATLSALAMAIGCLETAAYAENIDQMSSLMGFQVDADKQQMITWKTRVYLNPMYTVTVKGKKQKIIVGTASLDIGFARDKKYGIKQGNYSYYRLDTTMLHFTSLGKGDKSQKVYGYTNYLQVRAVNPNEGEILLAVSPLDIPGAVSYNRSESNSLSYSINSSKNISVGASSSISASQSFTESALGLYNESDLSTGKVNVKFNYTDCLISSTWKVYKKYAYYLSEQKASFAYLTKKAKYNRSFFFDVSYYLWNDTPCLTSKRINVGDTGVHKHVDTSVLIIPPFPE